MQEYILVWLMFSGCAGMSQSSHREVTSSISGAPRCWLNVSAVQTLDGNRLFSQTLSTFTADGNKEEEAVLDVMSVRWQVVQHCFLTEQHAGLKVKSLL